MAAWIFRKLYLDIVRRLPILSLEGSWGKSKNSLEGCCVSLPNLKLYIHVNSNSHSKVKDLFPKYMWFIKKLMNTSVESESGCPQFLKVLPDSNVVLGESWGVAAVVVIIGGSRIGRILAKRGTSPRLSLMEYVLNKKPNKVINPQYYKY